MAAHAAMTIKIHRPFFSRERFKRIERDHDAAFALSRPLDSDLTAIKYALLECRYALARTVTLGDVNGP